MKRYLLAPIFIGSILVSSCEQTCEYGPPTSATFTVKITPAPVGGRNCANSPVVVTLVNEFGFEDGPILTSDKSNPPRSCIEALGLVDGASVQVSFESLVDSNQDCPYTRYKFPNGDMSGCDAACHEPTTCPDSAPERGTACSGSVSCSYGDHYDCPPDVGYTYTYDCVDGRWLVVEKGFCPACVPNCDLEPPPPGCIPTCAELITPAQGLKPPVDLVFCNATSQSLYEAAWTCSCVAGNPCESACGASMYCSNGPQTVECWDCLQLSEPDGCRVSFDACTADN
jgi:hypothetical protein